MNEVQTVQFSVTGKMVELETQLRIPYKGYLIVIDVRGTHSTGTVCVKYSENVLNSVQRAEPTAEGIRDAMGWIDQNPIKTSDGTVHQT